MDPLARELWRGFGAVVLMFFVGALVMLIIDCYL